MMKRAELGRLDAALTGVVGDEAREAATVDWEMREYFEFF